MPLKFKIMLWGEFIGFLCFIFIAIEVVTIHWALWLAHIGVVFRDECLFLENMVVHVRDILEN